jgi:hypothetical protein
MELPGEESLRFIVSQYAAFKAAHGRAIGTPDLVLPTGEFFPDEFKGDIEGVVAFLKRMLSYAPVASDLPVTPSFIAPEEDDGQGSAGGCGSGGCSPGKGGGKGAAVRDGVVEHGDGYLVELGLADVRTATMLGTAFARSIGAIVLHEAGEADEDISTKSEIAAAACGFGVLLANGSYVYAKGCGGVKVHSATRLDVSEQGVLLALFVRDHGIKPGLAKTHLDTTPREAFEAGIAWCDSNTEIMHALATRPETLAGGLFTISPVKGLLGRIFGRRRSVDAEPPVVPVARRQRTPEEERRIAESRALVEEALGNGE